MWLIASIIWSLRISLSCTKFIAEARRAWISDGFEGAVEGVEGVFPEFVESEAAEALYASFSSEILAENSSFISRVPSSFFFDQRA